MVASELSAVSLSAFAAPLVHVVSSLAVVAVVIDGVDFGSAACGAVLGKRLIKSDDDRGRSRDVESKPESAMSSISIAFVFSGACAAAATNA